MFEKVLLECPHCRKLMESTIGNKVKKIVRCRLVDGGCGREFAVEAELNVKYYTLQETKKAEETSCITTVRINASGPYSGLSLGESFKETQEEVKEDEKVRER